MVIVNLIGGLGNQMFQYAAGRALTLERGESLRVDVAGLGGNGPRQFELPRIFRCAAEIASADDVRRALGWQAMPLVKQILARRELAAMRARNFVVEPHFHYWQGIRSVPKTAYLHGYWQSEKYFSDAASALRDDFSFKLPLSGANAAMAERIGRCPAVSLHVRRGDYVSNPVARAVHGFCSIDYYRAAIRLIAERITALEFFVFSDDIAWVRNNLDIGFPCHYVDHNRGAESYNDMRLMSLCRHHIIANSSFSWWSAWLSADPARIVIAPKQWFQNAPHDTSDLIPDGWIRL
jgi:hypothetical protein